MVLASAANTNTAFSNTPVDGKNWNVSPKDKFKVGSSARNSAGGVDVDYNVAFWAKVPVSLFLRQAPFRWLPQHHQTWEHPPTRSEQ